MTLPRRVTEALAERLEGRDVGPDDLVFTDSKGGPVRHSNYRRRVWVPALENIGIGHYQPLPSGGRRFVPGARIHDLRHTAVSLAIAAGAHPKAIQERLGHANIRTTLDVYGHLMPGLDEELAERMDAFSGEAPTASARPGGQGSVIGLPSPEASNEA